MNWTILIAIACSVPVAFLVMLIGWMFYKRTHVFVKEWEHPSWPCNLILEAHENPAEHLSVAILGSPWYNSAPPNSPMRPQLRRAFWVTEQEWQDILDQQGTYLMPDCDNRKEP